ncbi:MAG TPA: hypothetical protein VL422_16295 [Miltoncostaea sp.]|nr:hypothetical protein [Miltoncostaea sp.]
MASDSERRLRVDPRSGDPSVPVDDPTGGRSLSRRLAIALPICLIAGLALGIPLAVAGGDWRIVIPCVLAPMAIVGTLLAMIEDGRVQRQVDETTGRRR